MGQSRYTNKKLLSLAKINYVKMETVCKTLEAEGYWKQPSRILKHSIQEFMDLYVQAALINLAVYCGRLNEDERLFIAQLPNQNVLNYAKNEQDDPEEILQTVKNIMKSPPILLQLCGVRDMEKQSDLTEQFFDSFLNILLSMSHINNAKDNFVNGFIQEYYEKNRVFINRGSAGDTISPRYIFKKVSNDKVGECFDFKEEKKEVFRSTGANESKESFMANKLMEEEPKDKTFYVERQLEILQEDKLDNQIQIKKEETKLEKYLDELDALVGLTQVKEEISSLINLIKVRKLRKEYRMPVMEMTYHMVFTGNPGTGKTTVARLIAKIYKELGILSKGILVETDRSGLVAGYVGQTALKVKEVAEKALGGVLFIDEAYSLSNQIANDFGGEAVDALVKMMEDHRDNLVVIVAGYKQEMKTFLDSNTGLVSRFNKFIEFEDYVAEDLMAILVSMACQAGVTLSKDALQYLKEQILKFSNEEVRLFGNARGIRNAFEKIMMKQANRLVDYETPTKEQLCEIVKEDVIGIIEK